MSRKPIVSNIVPSADIPSDKLRHGDYVNRCLMVVLNHGYDVQCGGKQVTYDETHGELIYGPEAPILETVKITGIKNKGYPRPWDFEQADPEHVGTLCACGVVIEGHVHKCAILGCRQHTCNKIMCPDNHYQKKHKISIGPY